MFFLNLTAGELIALLGTLSALVTTLYLLDRSRRRKLVSTLRFWGGGAAEAPRRARPQVRQPWSLFLQLLSLLLLLLAIAQVQFGQREQRGRDYVLLIDTSSWTGEHRESNRTLLDDEKDAARQYLNGLARTDRVMLVAADALATPLTPFTADRQRTLAELSDLSSGWSSLGIERVLSFAREAQGWSEARKGEIVYIGPACSDDEMPASAMSGVRMIKVEAGRENVGIRSLTVRQSEDEPDSWQAFLTLRNYGTKARPVRVETHYGSTRFADRMVTLRPQREESIAYFFLARSPGDLVAEIKPGDVLPADDRAGVRLPGSTAVEMAVFTDRPTALRPLLDAARRLRFHFYTPAQYSPQTANTDFVLLDRFSPTTLPPRPALFIDPPRQHAPLPVKADARKAEMSWMNAPDLGPSIRAKHLFLPAALVFQSFSGDVPVATVPEGPVVLERPAGPSSPKFAVIGFDPVANDLRYQVSVPLLFADLIEWLSPNAFRSLEISAQRVGTAEVTLLPGEQNQELRATDERGVPVPLTRRENQVQLFVGRPSVVHLFSKDRERILSLSLPDVSKRTWNGGSQELTGLPLRSKFIPRALDLWRWFAALAALCLALEWFLWGTGRKANHPAASATKTPLVSSERELVEK